MKITGRQIVIGAGFNDQALAYFHLRSISVAEEEEFTAKIASLSEMSGDDRNVAELEICISSLETWSISAVSSKNAKTNEYAPLFSEDKGNGVKSFFEQFDANDAHRLASQIVYAFRLKLQPTVVFP